MGPGSENACVCNESQQRKKENWEDHVSVVWKSFSVVLLAQLEGSVGE